MYLSWRNIQSSIVEQLGFSIWDPQTISLTINTGQSTEPSEPPAVPPIIKECSYTKSNFLGDFKVKKYFYFRPVRYIISYLPLIIRTYICKQMAVHSGMVF